MSVRETHDARAFPARPARSGAAGKRASAGDIWRLLEDVPDPEIPAVSVVDLGIVRGVEQAGDEVVVTVTPTYSGCPATAAIRLDIEKALRARGFDRVRVESRLAPPWTTDWISAEGRAKLRAYGIAPPEPGGCAGTAAAPVACPRCGSLRTERVSQFGSTPCKAQHRCADCLEPFDRFKRI